MMMTQDFICVYNGKSKTEFQIFIKKMVIFKVNQKKKYKYETAVRVQHYNFPDYFFKTQSTLSGSTVRGPYSGTSVKKNMHLSHTHHKSIFSNVFNIWY